MKANTIVWHWDRYFYCLSWNGRILWTASGGSSCGFACETSVIWQILSCRRLMGWFFKGVERHSVFHFYFQNFVRFLIKISFDQLSNPDQGVLDLRGIGGVHEFWQFWTQWKGKIQNAIKALAQKSWLNWLNLNVCIIFELQWTLSKISRQTLFRNTCV